jgi:hypothetical protein
MCIFTTRNIAVSRELQINDSTSLKDIPLDIAHGLPAYAVYSDALRHPHQCLSVEDTESPTFM